MTLTMEGTPGSFKFAVVTIGLPSTPMVAFGPVSELGADTSVVGASWALHATSVQWTLTRILR